MKPSAAGSTRLRLSRADQWSFRACSSAARGLTVTSGHPKVGDMLR